MAMLKWNPPSPLTGKRNWIENFFAETDDFFKNWEWDRKNDVPEVNVREEDDAFLIEVAAPGMKKEDFQVEMDNGVLIISASTEENKEPIATQYRRQEFNFRNFRRSFWLPENVAPDMISATYENGLLKLILPKTQALVSPKSKKIQVV
jgi:HSP20 family protein